MNGFKCCMIYIAAIGIAGFLFGRALPKRWFRYDELPFRELPVEHGGNLYRKIGIHRWHKRLPDMSRLLPSTMPKKQLTAHISAAQAEIMVQETCIAEFIHALLSLCGMYLPSLWPGPGGLIFCLLYVALGNLPFILVQRFNRPKLRMLLDKCRHAEKLTGNAAEN